MTAVSSHRPPPHADPQGQGRCRLVWPYQLRGDQLGDYLRAVEEIHSSSYLDIDKIARTEWAPAPCCSVTSWAQPHDTRNGGIVIARIWRGAVHTEDADEYVAYVRDTGIEHYRSTPGNQGAWILRRPIGDLTEIVTFSLWESMAAVRAFAGDDPSHAVYYPDDDRFLVERSLLVEHYEVD